MKVSLKIVLTFVVNIIAMFVINVIKNADSEYNTGLFVMIIIVGSIAGVITIWSNYSKNNEAKANN
jgi:fluoride ion exporter CrcB/FEX